MSVFSLYIDLSKVGEKKQKEKIRHRTEKRVLLFSWLLMSSYIIWWLASVPLIRECNR